MKWTIEAEDLRVKREASTLHPTQEKEKKGTDLFCIVYCICMFCKGTIAEKEAMTNGSTPESRREFCMSCAAKSLSRERIGPWKIYG
jgi:hypothetical protein